MAFWTHGNSSGDSRRTARVGGSSGIAPTSTSSSSNSAAARTAAANLFRDRESPIDTDEMFFETTPTVSFPSRSRWADRMASSVFDDFPPRRMASMDPTSFGSLHRHRQPPSWMSDARGGSKESSPTRSDSGGSLPRHAAFHRADSIPVHVAHESSRHGSRSSTPESTGSGSASSRPSSLNAGGGGDYQNHVHQEGDVVDGVEEHPMATSRAGKQGFTARHQPKVHHIPIHVEPRDGPPPQQSYATLTPPIVESPPQAVSFNVVHEQSQSPPVVQQEARRSSFPSDQAGLHQKRASQHKAQQRHPSNLPKPMSGGGGWEIPVQQETVPPQPQPQPAPAAAAQPVKPKKKTPFEILDEVKEDVAKLKENVVEFKGSKGDKAYVYLDEMLTRNLIRLDNIETEGNEELRRARRAVITAINECISNLEHVASGNDAAAAADAATEIDEERQQQCAEEMDTKVEEVVVQNEVTMGTEENDVDGSSTEVPEASGLVVDEAAEVEAPAATENCVEVADVEPEPQGEVAVAGSEEALEVEPPAAEEPAPIVQEPDEPKCGDHDEPMECQEIAAESQPVAEVAETVSEEVSVVGGEDRKEPCSAPS